MATEGMWLLVLVLVFSANRGLDAQNSARELHGALIDSLVERAQRAPSFRAAGCDALVLGKPHHPSTSEGDHNGNREGYRVNRDNCSTSLKAPARSLSAELPFNAGFPSELANQIKKDAEKQRAMRVARSSGLSQTQVATAFVKGSKRCFDNRVCGEVLVDAEQCWLELLKRAHAQNEQLPVGTRVEVRGLKNRIDLNGLIGEITGYDEFTGRCEIFVAGGVAAKVSCKPGNLAVIKAPISSISHAEKKALAFLHACGTTNLSVSIDFHTCLNCHEFFKSSSLLLRKSIQLHQPMMTHTFINGSCSCSGAVQAVLRYRSHDSPQSVFSDGPSADDWFERDMIIKDGRQAKRLLELNTNGFELRVARAMLPDYYDESKIVTEYYKDCESLLRHVTNASFVKAFDHNRRSSGEGVGHDIPGSKPVQMPFAFVHGDYTVSSASEPLRQLLEGKGLAEHLRLPRNGQSLVREALAGERRYAIVNVWRPFAVVKSMPLACLDASTIPAIDLITFQSARSALSGSAHWAKHRQSHQWYYFPEMTPDEVILIKTWDSHGDLSQNPQAGGSTSTFALHSAFEDPYSSINAPSRLSIEVRVAIVY